MRIFVIHDAKGNIRSFGVPAAEVRGQVTLEPPRGQRVSEVDVPGLDQISAQDVHQQLRQLSETLKTQRVQRGQGQTTLVPRGAGKKR
jgi:hypothetical protein